MLSSSLTLTLLLFLQGAPVASRPPGEECEGRRHIELAGGAGDRALEVCIGPGLVTSFVFDAPVVVDVQEETRFVDVTRGRNSVNLIPPRDLVPGERLRLTAHLGAGAIRDDVTLTLVASEGAVTHQVDVSWQPRSRDSLREEVAVERARRVFLEAELERLRASPSHLGGLLGLITTGALGVKGIQMYDEPGKPVGYSEDQLTVTRCIRYRSDKSVAAQVWLRNSGDRPWSVTGASVVVPGEPPHELAWHTVSIAPNAVGHIVVELEAERQQARGPTTLSLWDEAGERTIHIPEVTFPE